MLKTFPWLTLQLIATNTGAYKHEHINIYLLFALEWKILSDLPR